LIFCSGSWLLDYRYNYIINDDSDNRNDIDNSKDNE
jgi:hypothetical protein